MILRRALTLTLVTIFLIAAVFALHPFAVERSVFIAAGRLGAPHAGLLIPLTRLGNFIVLGPLALIVAGWLFAIRRKHAALWLIATVLAARLLAQLLKFAFGRPRPDLLPRLDQVYSSSFPSAHSANSMATFLAIALVLRLPLWPAIVLALAVGVSRVLLGVHWPSDVAGGWALGALVVIVAARWRPARAA